MPRTYRKVNVAIAGGPCTGKTTLAASLFAAMKYDGYDYDLVTEESRKLKKEFGGFRTPFDRFYMWRQQEREELRSTAKNGFITDKPLFHFYIQSIQYAKEPRDWLAVRELLRMCMEIQEKDRYQLVVIARDPFEIKYKRDQVRSSKVEEARERHELIEHYLGLFWRKKMMYVEGPLEERLEQVKKRLVPILNEPKKSTRKKKSN